MLVYLYKQKKKTQKTATQRQREVKAALKLRVHYVRVCVCVDGGNLVAACPPIVSPCESTKHEPDKPFCAMTK